MNMLKIQRFTHEVFWAPPSRCSPQSKERYIYYAAHILLGDLARILPRNRAPVGMVMGRATMLLWKHPLWLILRALCAHYACVMIASCVIDASVPGIKR